MPRAFDRALAQRAGELKNVKVRMIGHLTPLEMMRRTPRERASGRATGISSGIPGLISRRTGVPISPIISVRPRYYEDSLDVDIAVQIVTPMDKHGYFNFGPLCISKRPCSARRRPVVVEVVEDMPWCYGGYDECIHLSDVDYVIENKTDKLITIPSPPANDTDKKIAGYIADMIPKDGPCLQIGIGGLPSMVLRLLADSGAHDIGIHTEMVTEAIMELHEAVLITGKKKTLLPEKVVWTFSIGSRKLYDWIDRNPALAMYPVEYTNDPYVIAMNKDLISVNACLGVDLQGQVSSESIGPAQYSGTGGQLAFVRGAYYRATRNQPPLGYANNKSILAFTLPTPTAAASCTPGSNRRSRPGKLSRSQGWTFHTWSPNTGSPI